MEHDYIVTMEMSGPTLGHREDWRGFVTTPHSASPRVFQFPDRQTGHGHVFQDQEASRKINT